MKRSTGWNQEVTDEEGRRRFHGAFTGGFSAGYFNSVGTKEGWQPATFSSSRQERGRVQQRAEDFMDEDDDPLLGKRLETTAQYDTLQARARQQQQRLAVEGKPRNAFEAQVLNMTQRPAVVSAYPAMNFLDDLVRPVNDSIGAKLLNQMGWKEGHGIGPRIRKKKISDDTKQAARKQLIGSAHHEADDRAAEDDVVYIPPRNTIDVSAFPKPKLDKYGAGFDPYVNAPEFSRYKQHQENELAQKQQKRQVVTFADAMKATSGSYETVTAFGLGALEDNDDLDVYGTSAMSEFDTAIGHVRLTNGKEVKLIDSEERESLSHGAKKHRRAPVFGTDGRPALPGFELAYVKEKPPKAVALRLEVPSDFKPFHRFHGDDDEKRNRQRDPAAALYEKHNFTTRRHGQGSLMTAKQRADLLGEPQQSVQKAPDAGSSTGGTTSGGSVFDLLGAEQKARIFSVAAQAKLSSASNVPMADVASITQAPKAREPLVKGAAGNQFRANISASIAKRFVSASSTSEQQNGNDQATAEQSSSTTTTAKQSHRTEIMWIPNSLLCKRFHVKCLVGNMSGREASGSEEKRDLFDKELVPHLVEFAAERRVSKGAGTPDVTTGSSLAAQTDPSRPANRNPKQTTKEEDGELSPLPIVEKPAASLLKSIFEPSDESDVEEDEDENEDASDDEEEAKGTGPIGLVDARVSIDQNSLAAEAGKRSAVVRGNDTKRDERLPRGGKDRAAADISSNDESSSSSDSEDEEKSIRNSATADSIHLRDDAANGANDNHSERDRKKKTKSSKKHKRKHKKKKHHRSSRYKEDTDDSENDDEHADRKHRKKRKEAKKKSSSSSRKKKPSHKRSRSASRDRSETPSSSNKHHRRH